LDAHPPVLYVDLTGPVVHDAGAGLLASLGAIGDAPLDRGALPLAQLTALDLRPARALVADTELIGVVPAAELGALLLGLRGITSRLGRERDADPGRMLAVDSALERYASFAAPQSSAAPGSGACGGLGFAILALGGRLVVGPDATLGGSRSDRSTSGRVTFDTAFAGARPELVLTGCDSFDFARRGGGVVAEAARLATDALAPCVVLAGDVYVGAREMRSMGIEAAYAVRADAGPADTPAGAVSAGELAELARRVARTWRW
jgi:glycerate 2-kinase